MKCQGRTTQPSKHFYILKCKIQNVRIQQHNLRIFFPNEIDFKKKIRTKQEFTVISGTSCWRWSFWRRRRFYNWIAGRSPTKNYITKKIEKLYWEYVFKMSGWNFRQIRNFSRIKMGTSWRIVFVSKYYRSDMDNRCLC